MFFLWKSEISEEHKRLFSKVKDNDRELQKLRKENAELKQNLQKIIEKEENDKRYRMEIERVQRVFFGNSCGFCVGKKRDQLGEKRGGEEIPGGFYGHSACFEPVFECSL